MEFDLLTTLTNETYLLTAVNAGQIVRFNGERIVTTAGQTVRLHGNGPVLISKGSAWTNRARYAGDYDGPYFDGDTQSTTALEYLDVTRQIGDGPEILIGTGYSPGDAGTDPLPHLTEVNKYRAISRTSLPTEAIGKEAEITIGEKIWTYFNTGPGFGEVYRLCGDPTREQTTLRSSSVRHMAGIEWPTMVRGSSKSAGYSIGGTITPHSSQREDLEELGYTETVVCFRDFAGRRIFGNIGAIQIKGVLLETVGMSFTRIPYVEGLYDS